jgi:hypothetical protein
MDHSAGFGYAQLAIVQDLVKRMGRSKEFGEAQWAVVQHLVVCSGP